MRVAVDLIQNRLNMGFVVALNVFEVGSPAIVGSWIGYIDRVATGIGQRNWNRVDLGTKEIIDACAARTVRPFICRMLVGSSCVATVGFYNFKDGIHAEIFVRVDGAQPRLGLRGRKWGSMEP